MDETSKTCSPQTSEALPSAISSPELESGVTRYASPAGPMTDLFGREVALAPVSRVQAKATGLMTLATSGLLGIDSSPSAEFQRSLESSLMKQLDSAGSTLFKLTWRGKATPLGRRYLEQQALALRTPVFGCTSVPTPNTPSGGPNSKSTKTHTGGMDLEGAASMATMPRADAGTETHSTAFTECSPEKSAPILATVASPTAMDHSRGGKPARPWDTGIPVSQQVALATVATPRAEDSESTGAHRGIPDTLNSQGNLCSVASPSARDWKDSPGMSETGVDPDGSIRTPLDQLPRQAQLADSGETATGGTGAMKNSGQLATDYSRWLMGLPTVWESCADMVTRSSRRKPKRL